MTVEALENRRSAQLVTARAASGTLKLFVSASKGPRRNLGAGSSQQNGKERQDLEKLTHEH